MNRTLYISARCEHCIHILKGIKQYSFLKGIFNIVNVDTTPFPNNITSVPAIDINGQLIIGKTVFEYLGKLVESKNNSSNTPANMSSNNMPTTISSKISSETDSKQCNISGDGELEGYCCNGLNCGLITEKDDNNTSDFHKFQLSYDMLENDNNDIHQQIAEMEKNDNELNNKHGGFDSDLERLQRERGDMMKR